MTTSHHHFSPELKIKGMSLAQEARIIRKYENRLRAAQRHHAHCKEQRERLGNHRRHDLRREARATYLAHGFLCGRSYLVIEPLHYSVPDWKAVERMAERYGALAGADLRGLKQRFSAFMDEEKAHRLPYPSVRKKRIRPSKGKPKE